MAYSSSIFRSSGIEGIVPDELDEETAEKIGRAFAQFTSANKVCVGRDTRATGLVLQAALIRGLTEQGVDVIDVGVVDDALFYFSVGKSKSDAGVMVSATQSSEECNGFILTRAQAVPISKDTGLLDIRAMVEKSAFPVGNKIGLATKDDYSKEYLDSAQQ